MDLNYSDFWSDYTIFSEFERENNSVIEEKSDQELYVPQTLKKKTSTSKIVSKESSSFLTKDNENFLTSNNENFKTK